MDFEELEKEVRRDPRVLWIPLLVGSALSFAIVALLYYFL